MSEYHKYETTQAQESQSNMNKTEIQMQRSTLSRLKRENYTKRINLNLDMDIDSISQFATSHQNISANKNQRLSRRGTSMAVR